MFVPAEMSEVDIFVMEGDVEPVAQSIARLGVMHLLDVNALGQWAEEVGTEWIGRITAYTTQERRIRELLRSLGIAEQLQPCEGRLNPADDLATIEEDLREIEAQTHRFREEEAALRREAERWELTLRSLEMLAPLSVSIKDLRQLEHLHLVAGTIPSDNLARLETSLFRIPYTIMPVHRYAGRVLVFAFCAHEHAAILDRALESAFLDRLSLPEEFSGTAQEALDQANARLQQVRQQLVELGAQREAFVREVGPRLQVLETRVLGDRAIAEAMAHFGHRGRVFLIAGWVPKNRVAELRNAVEEATNGRVTFEENSPYSPGAESRVPTLLRHGRLLKPMESLVTTYGIPGYNEMDPTLVLGLTFVLMFGFMFGDLGQGFVLALLGGLLAGGALPRLAQYAGAGMILLACGLSSMVFGVLFGSVFGLESLLPPLWLNPLQDIWKLLLASVAFGVVLLNIGFAFRLATAVRQRRLYEAIFDKHGLVGLGLYWSLLGTVAAIALGWGIPWWLAALDLTLTLLLLLGEPLTARLSGQPMHTQGSILEQVLQWAFVVFEALISYISNTLSYVRLGAFAVAHLGLAMAVFQIADLLVQAGAGTAARTAVIVLGNVVIIGFEGLIVAIQTLRLEYYELFGKFFGGTGVPFRPLALPETECERMA